MSDIFDTLRRRLIVSCQALPGNPLRDPHCIAAMARAAVQGGAAAIRANGPDDLRAIAAVVDVPLIGINKTAPSPTIPYITPTFESAAEIAEIPGVKCIAIDATDRPRPDGGDAATLIRRIHDELRLPVLADISTFREGVAAARAGADAIATTLAGYTADSPKTDGPDLELVRQLHRVLNLPLIAEGRFLTPEHLAAGFAAGADAVVIGKIITNPEFITRYFIAQAGVRS